MSQLRLLAAASLLVAAAVAYADHPRHHRPPQEAIDACASAKSGDSCTFTMPARDGSGSSHTLTGTCESPPKEAETTTLACRPDHPPPHGGHDGPPPQPAGD